MIHRVDYRRYRLPLRTAVHTTHGSWREREGLLVRLERADGGVGFGEVAPVPAFGTETLAEAEHVVAGFGGEIDAAGLAGVGEQLGCVRFALASALVPEAIEPPPGVRRPVARLLPAGRAALAATKIALGEGYVVCKWKVGVFAAAEERAILADLLGRLAPGTVLRLDANGGWTAREAGRWLDCCANRPIEFVEQPVAPGDEDALLGLARDYPTPLALDESVTGLPSLRRWLERGWPGIVVVKPALAGAPAELLATLETHHADAVFSSAFETAVGRRAALGLALRYQGRQPPRALGFGAGPLFADDRLDGNPGGPFVTADDVNRIDLEAAWNALN